MNIKEIREVILPYIDEPIVNFIIEKKIFDKDSGRKRFNQTIRKNTAAKFCVYIWVENATEEIVYIGMAGKIKTDGSTGDYTIQNRLLATGGKDKHSGKDIQTNDYIRDFLTKNNIDFLNIFIMYSKKDEPPAYLEALMLYKYYKKNKRLPKLNTSF